ncbi:hypothetical protein K1T71_012115 [Dendrolimus kikuchii]|uniref:Uncharacterized protein n=1 Tax=Dendrolimus kikuchii TaxID=765133 RepID=A0ACC1CKP8_9NEOP|nr:hypothetical protein K1T71_012115 [Dendrolimus kikuchii]
MLHLTTFCMLLALTVAQNGYDYSKPRHPFPSSSSRPGYPSGPLGSYPTTTSYPGRQQNDDYAGSSTPGFPSGPSNYPTGPQGFPGSGSQRPQTGYPGQGPTGPDGYQGQNGASFPGGPGHSSIYPNGPSFGPGSPGFGPGGPGFGPGSNGYRPGISGFASGSDDTGEYEGGDYSAIPGQPNIDYPIHSYIPSTSFSCDSQAYPGYYADVETRCQVFHVCANNKTYDFLCPNGTIFSQEVFVCVWWDQFDCNSAPSLYGLNANLYDYSITGSQSGFGALGPNDYSQGPRGPSYSGGSPQGPNSGFPGSSGPYGPVSGYPGSSGPSGFPGSSGPHGSTNGYPGSSRPSSPGSYPTSTPYPGSSGPHGPSTSGSYPGTGPGTSYPGSGPSNYPGSNSGYPSGKPSGPGFPSGGGRPQQPNREYLPPN